MHKIGITGGISSGKSVAAKIFKDKKESFIYNADKESKKHLKNSHSLQKKLINVFGNQITLKTKFSIFKSKPDVDTKLPVARKYFIFSPISPCLPNNFFI